MRAAWRALVMGTLMVGVTGVVGCSAPDVPHESFMVSKGEAWTDLRRMRAEPVALARPVLVLAGYRSPPMNSNRLASALCRATSGRDEDFLAIDYTFRSTEAGVMNKVLLRVLERWPGAMVPTPAGVEPIGVDVVGISMGGLLGRAIAIGASERPAELNAKLDERVRGLSVRVSGLTTIGSPHLGASMAERVAPDELARAMKPGSEWLQRLEGARRAGLRYEIVPYTRIRDGMVGATRTAPPGQEPIWVTGPRLWSHTLAANDERIVSDIARRLRGEEPRGQPATPPRD